MAAVLIDIQAMESLRPSDFFDLADLEHASLFEDIAHPWEVLPRLSAYLKEKLQPAMQGRMVGSAYIGPNVWIGEGTVIEHGACILGPAWIGPNCVVRTGAYIRENVIVESECVLGNSCEFKNCLVLKGAQIPHFSYVGDSIVGRKAHLGAGVILSNLKLDQSTVRIRHDNDWIDTGLRKFGAIVGDGCEIGAHAVINPGSLLGPHSVIYPGVMWRGVLPRGMIAKAKSECTLLPRHGF